MRDDKARAALLAGVMALSLAVIVALCIAGAYWAWHENSGYLPGVPVRITQNPGGFALNVVEQINDGRTVLYVSIPIIWHGR
jgi:hypothetical protein